jgi:hypoxia up-regulated 1
LDVEELVLMQFAYVRALAEEAAGERVQDVVVTVPAFYAQFERDAIADADELAGLRLLALVNDGAAVAVNYAMNSPGVRECLCRHESPDCAAHFRRPG